MSDFGDVRSAVHASDMRALIEASYRKRRYVLHEMHERYISDTMPEYEHEVYRWACAMVNHLLEVTNVPHVMTRAFASTWAEWMLAGAVGYMPIRLWANNTDVTFRMLLWDDHVGWRSAHLLHISNPTQMKRDKSWRAVWLNEYVYRQ